MQTELTAIRETLKHATSNDQGNITIHIDCKSAIQAIQQHEIKDNNPNHQEYPVWGGMGGELARERKKKQDRVRKENFQQRDNNLKLTPEI